MKTAHERIFRKIALCTLAALPGIASIAHAQESANAELDNCVKEQQLVMTAKGAGAGLIAGLGVALLTGKKDDALKNAAIGAGVGGVAGFATAYFTAVDTCFKKNPEWIPESKLQRTKNYAQVKKDLKYKPAHGIKTQVTRMEAPATLAAGSTLELQNGFVALTPDGAELPVTLQRKLFAVDADGKETALSFPGRGIEQRTIEPGEHRLTDRVPFPKDTPSGSKYRVEFSINADGKPVSTQSRSVTVL